MKIVVDKLPENPLECVFSRINTGTRRCAHNAKICPLTRGEECPFLMGTEPRPHTATTELAPALESLKPKSKRSTGKKVSD